MKFEWTISFGHVASVLALIVSGIVAYTNIVKEQAIHERRLTSIESVVEERIRQAEARNGLMEARVRAVEVSQASMSSDLRNIQVGINRIEAAIERLNQGQRP